MPIRHSRPCFEESLERLLRSGWDLGHRGHHVPGVGVRYAVVGFNGGHQVRAAGSTLSEAWHRAAEQAAWGTLQGWPPGGPRLCWRRCRHGGISIGMSWRG
jgi:hypothetical protein